MPLPDPTDVADLPAHHDPANTSIKPAWKTTEFWLSTIAMLVGLLLASGVFSPDDPSDAKVLRVLGLVASILSSLGYTAARTSAKNRAVEGAALVAAAKAGALLESAGVGLTVPTKPAAGP